MMLAAAEKIKVEMEKEKNPYVKVVGEFMLQQLEKFPEAAEKILAGDKTIMKSLEEMQKVASKNKVGNMAVLTDAEGFAVVLKYFGIQGDPTIPVPSAAPALAVSPIKPANAEFDVKLDDFL
jgi:hypothetical protein